MNIILKDLTLTSYTETDIEKIKFIKELKYDPLIDKFLYSCINDMIKKSETTPNLHLGYGYIVKDKEKEELIGFVRPARIKNCALDIDYGVHPEYRHQGYGTKILVEVSDFFLENFENIHKIKLSIRSDNEYSVKCAQKAGFSEVEEKYPREYKTFIKRR